MSSLSPGGIHCCQQTPLLRTPLVGCPWQHHTFLVFVPSLSSVSWEGSSSLFVRVVLNLLLHNSSVHLICSRGFPNQQHEEVCLHPTSQPILETHVCSVSRGLTPAGCCAGWSGSSSSSAPTPAPPPGLSVSVNSDLCWLVPGSLASFLDSSPNGISDQDLWILPPCREPTCLYPHHHLA